VDEMAILVEPFAEVIVTIAFRIPAPSAVNTWPLTLTDAAVGEDGVLLQKPEVMPKFPAPGFEPAAACPDVPTTVNAPPTVSPPPPAITEFVMVNVPPDCGIAAAGISMITKIHKSVLNLFISVPKAFRRSYSTALLSILLGSHADQ
jgi:hypothetical protein